MMMTWLLLRHDRECCDHNHSHNHIRMLVLVLDLPRVADRAEVARPEHKTKQNYRNRLVDARPSRRV
jgi:hypothetical protein